MSQNRKDGRRRPHARGDQHPVRYDLTEKAHEALGTQTPQRVVAQIRTAQGPVLAQLEDGSWGPAKRFGIR